MEPSSVEDGNVPTIKLRHEHYAASMEPSSVEDGNPDPAVVRQVDPRVASMEPSSVEDGNTHPESLRGRQEGRFNGAVLS